MDKRVAIRSKAMISYLQRRGVYNLLSKMQTTKSGNRINIWLSLCLVAAYGASVFAQDIPSVGLPGRDLENQILWSIAHEGCDVYEGDEFRSSNALRTCYLSAEAHNPSASSLLRETSPEAILNATRRATLRAKDEYKIVENFREILFDERDLSTFVHLANQNKFKKIRSKYKEIQSDNPNARNVLSALKDSELQALIADEEKWPISRGVGTGTGGKGRWQISEEGTSIPVQEDLINHIRWSIAHEGCNVYMGDNVRPVEDLRSCYESVESGNSRAENLLIVANRDVIMQATRVAVTQVKADSGVVEHMNWLLIHEGRLDEFRELLEKRRFNEIRREYRMFQSYNPNARNLLSALSDSELSNLIQQDRVTLLIGENTPPETLFAVSDLISPEKVLLKQPTSLDDLLEKHYDPWTARYVSSVEGAHRFLGPFVSVDNGIVQPGTISLPVIPRPGQIVTVTLRHGVGYGEAKGVPCSGIQITPSRRAELLRSLPSTLAGQPSANPAPLGPKWYGPAIGTDKLKKSDLKLLSETHIAVIDAGVDPSHTMLGPAFWKLPVEFSGKVWSPGSIGYDYTNGTANPTEGEDSGSHGTHVTGLVTGRLLASWFPELREVALEHFLKTYSLRVAESQGVDFSFPTQAIFDGLDNGIHLFNVSLSGWAFPVLQEKLASAREQALLVVAVGETTDDLNTDKAFDGVFRDSNGNALSNVILVGALGSDGKGKQLWSSSNKGNHVVQIAAPGEAITSTFRGGGSGQLDGTSQAAPFVSLTAGILWAESPSALPSRIKSRILSTCDWVPGLENDVIGGCRLNMAKAIVTTADIVELNAGTWIRGTIDKKQFHLHAVGSSDKTLAPETLERVFFKDAKGVVQVGARGSARQEATMDEKSIRIDLLAGETCPGGSSPNCVIEIGQISDIIFRWAN